MHPYILIGLCCNFFSIGCIKPEISTKGIIYKHKASILLRLAIIYRSVCVCEFIKTSQGSEVVKTNTFLTVCIFGEQSVGVLPGTWTNTHCLWLQLITVLICNKALYLHTTSLFVYVDIFGKILPTNYTPFQGPSRQPALPKLLYLRHFPRLYCSHLLPRIRNELMNIFTEPVFLSSKAAAN